MHTVSLSKLDTIDHYDYGATTFGLLRCTDVFVLVLQGIEDACCLQTCGAGNTESLQHANMVINQTCSCFP